MNSKMIARRARVKASKKANKEGKKHKLTDTASTDFKVPTSATTSTSGSSDSSPDGESAAKKAKKSATDSAFGHQKDGKLKSTVANGSTAPNFNKSVQDDPTKSEVYKKLFSSHKSAQNQPKGHWVTFDPRYN
jgi:hypothetical protein